MIRFLTSIQELIWIKSSLVCKRTAKRYRAHCFGSRGALAQTDNLESQEVSLLCSGAGLLSDSILGVHHSGHRQYLIISTTLNHMAPYQNRQLAFRLDHCKH
jgi:hypothetical protein